MITFIFTLVVTALITYIITAVYYKHVIDHIRKSVVSQECDTHGGIKKYDLSYATSTTNNIRMDINPAYGTATTSKMDSNPAYAAITK